MPGPTGYSDINPDAGESSIGPDRSPDPRTAPRVIVAVTGGIACYKSCSLVSRLAQSGAAVRVVMTESATRFVAPLTFQSLSGSRVITDMWDVEEGLESPHIVLARWCHLLIIAPGTANTIAKIAAGLCDDSISLLAYSLPQATPVLLAPAMNADMWSKPVTQRNLKVLKEELGYHTVGPESGWQACRTSGPGRMSEPDTIFTAAEALLKPRSD